MKCAISKFSPCYVSLFSPYPACLLFYMTTPHVSPVWLIVSVFCVIVVRCANLRRSVGLVGRCCYTDFLRQHHHHHHHYQSAINLPAPHHSRGRYVSSTTPTPTKHDAVFEYSPAASPTHGESSLQRRHPK